jgi:hypothetical protein
MTEESQPTPPEAKRCFVVMGFGMKTDYATGRKLDLDKSYRLLIKPVVQSRGLQCVRADEILHSGAIDVPMYRELLTADVVIADLSTANPNALYELGIRHALRPRTTIVISENKLPYPFDLNHISIAGYAHLGEAIDFDEVMRFRDVLGQKLDAVLQSGDPDSPVYTFLADLTPPAFRAAASLALAAASAADTVTDAAPADDGRGAVPRAGAQDATLAVIVEQGEAAIRASDFTQAKALFRAALELGKSRAGPHPLTQHPYLVQRLTLATYKAKEPDEVTALNDALSLLSGLGLEESNDPETVGLAGAIEKRLFDRLQGDPHLERAISYYARGYYLRNDRYNGINLAYLFNLRADSALDATDQDRIADLVWANRLRRDVLALCEQELETMRERSGRMSQAAPDVAADQRSRDHEQKFWCLATKAEAHFGLGEQGAYEEARAAARALEPAAWMMASLDEQIGRLKTLLDKRGHLLVKRASA